jgi:hypothetical protein
MTIALGSSFRECVNAVLKDFEIVSRMQTGQPSSQDEVHLRLQSASHLRRF